MPRKRPRHVEQFRDRHGKLRIYFRRNKSSRRIPLPSDIGSEEFWSEYAKALSGQTILGKPPSSKPKAGTIAALITSYLRSSEYLELRETTKRGYSSRIKYLQEKHGQRTMSGLNRKRIAAILEEDYATKPGARMSLLKMLRILIRHAIRIDLLDRDPSLGIKRPKIKEIRPWTAKEIQQFEDTWSIGTKQRLAFSLMLYVGQRRGDIHRMSWSDIEQGGIRVTQQKTGAELLIPIHSELSKVLESSKKEIGTIIVTNYGRPFTVGGFSQWMREAITMAGLPLDCKPHGLRKSAAVRLAEAGCSTHEIKAITGHKTLAEVERYTRGANQRAMAERAIAKSEDHNANKLSQTER